MNKENKLILDRIYNDPNSYAAFTGINSLYEAAKKELKGKISKKDVQNYLEGHRTYSLMRPRRVHFKKAKTVPAGFMSDVQVDLADLQSLSRHNSGFRYLLVGIDVLSRRLFATPVKSKKAEDMVQAFKILIEQMPIKAFRIFSDLGKEFTNRLLKEFFNQEEIQKLESSSSFVKASLAERAIRNIKQRLYRYFAQHQNLNWINVIDKIIYGINRSKCRIHGLRPIDVNPDNAQKIWKRIYGNELTSERGKKATKFKKGQFVRMSRGKGLFEKGYIPSWGDEILEIDAVKDHVNPHRYKIKDERGEPFKGHFYAEELSKVRKEAATTYRIEKVYRKRKLPDGTYELLVKFIGYPDREWIHENKLV